MWRWYLFYLLTVYILFAGQVTKFTALQTSPSSQIHCEVSAHATDVSVYNGFFLNQTNTDAMSLNAVKINCTMSGWA